MNLSDAEKLRRLEDTGLHVVGDRLLNLFDEPSGVGRPPKSPSRRGKEEFTRDESVAVFTLLEAGRQEGRKGNGLFQLLESMDVQKNHSWQSYENHFRKAKAPAISAPTPPWKRPFPGMKSPSVSTKPTESADPEVARPSVPTPAADENDCTAASFSDSRIDVARNVHRQLGVTDKKELEHLIGHPAIVRAIFEYKTALLDPELEAGRQETRSTRSVPKKVATRSHHQWKIDHALHMLANHSRRFIGLDVDKTGWSTDDHDTRFIVRNFMDAVTSDHPWTSVAADRHALCERALWLMLWVRWIYKPGAGASEESLRTEKSKEVWRTRFSTLYRDHQLRRTQILPQGQVSRDSRSRQLDRAKYHAADPRPHYKPFTSGDAGPETRGRPSAASTKPLKLPSAVTAATDITEPAQDPDSIASQYRTKNYAKASRWLDDEAHRMFSNQQSMRLAGWGVTKPHKGSCVLVADLWSNQHPPDLMHLDPSDWPTSAALKQRLTISLRGYSVTWARAAAWFNDWPHTATELDDILLASNAAQSGPQFHASHLCHQGLCINPNHIIFEPAEINLDRIQCMYTAKALRAYGIAIPEHCHIHKQAPCLMHLAALETAEALSIQFFILREAAGVRQPEQIQIPASHPEHLTIFEHSIPTQTPLSSIRVERSEMAVPPQTSSFTTHEAEKHLITCCFCPNARRIWNSVTAYWSHLRTLHSDRSLEVLAEIRRSGEAYVQWADDHFHDLLHHNSTTWAKIVQIRAENFSWEVVQSWRLPQDRLNLGRSRRKIDE